MSLLIKTTGIEQFLPGGGARVRVLILGPGGSGKTRWSSYAPKPIYAACEPGVAAIADRGMPYVDINNSRDMLDFLNYMKLECRQPDANRKYQTVVIDTIDSYARKIKNEWMETNRKDTFTGWEAWSDLSQKLNLLLTRLLNLSSNVIILAHLKDKVIKDSDNDRESHELMIRLQGETADSIFDDFDFVGYMQSDYGVEEGKRVQKRQLTFTKTPTMPFLKDRLMATEGWLPVNFAPGDWESLFSALKKRLDTFGSSQEIGEIPTFDPEVAPMVATVESARSGALPPQPAPEVQLETLDKQALVTLCKQLGITKLATGTPIRGNTVKSELVEAIKFFKAQQSAAAVKVPETLGEPAKAESAPAAPKAQQPAPVVKEAPLKVEPEGTVNTETGEIVAEPVANPDRTVVEAPAEATEPNQAATDAAVKLVTEKLGGQVVDTPDVPAAEQEAPAAAQQKAEPAGPAANTSDTTCSVENCGADLTKDPKPDYVRVGWIRFRKRVCSTHFLALKNG